MIFGYILFFVGAVCVLIQIGCLVVSIISQEHSFEVLNGFALWGCVPAIAGLQIGAAIVEGLGGG